jgi:hypothetical protein
MSGLSVCLFRSWQIVSTKTHHPKKQKDVEGSIFLPLVANLEHTHMNSSPQFATQPPIHCCKLKSFKNLLVTGRNRPHKTSFFFFVLVLRTDSRGIHFPAFSGHFGTCSREVHSSICNPIHCCKLKSFKICWWPAGTSQNSIDYLSSLPLVKFKIQMIF